jgi:hypothetical protein
LLEIDVLEEVTPDDPDGNGISIHLDASYLGDRTLNRHETLTKILVDQFIWVH